MNFLDEISRDIEGVKLLTDWLGEGGRPVPSEQAAGRALVCLRGDDGNPCPHNKAPGWWYKHVKDPIAAVITTQLEIKSRMSLSTPHDASLFMCGKCGCCLKLKVQVPLEHIKAHTPESKITELPAFCWLRIELENL